MLVLRRKINASEVLMIYVTREIVYIPFPNKVDEVKLIFKKCKRIMKSFIKSTQHIVMFTLKREKHY